MKKLYILMFVLLASCGGGGGDAPTTEQTNEPNPTLPIHSTLNWDNTNWNSNWN